MQQEDNLIVIEHLFQLMDTDNAYFPFMDDNISFH